MDTGRLARLAVLTAAALTLHVAESWFPVALPGLPGVKLGLANSVTLLILLLCGPRDGLLTAILRVTLGSLFGGGLTGFAFSMTGAILSWAVMAALLGLFRDRIHPVSVSILGAMAHNAGQLTVAALFSGPYVFSYLLALLLAAVVTGAFVGTIVSLLYRRLAAGLPQQGKPGGK